ncbi:hypothetical protein [Actinomyces gaoshouyii]|uniref:Lipoprotein n=1 Tax=Actinomyces gaoshouyii TaxID=1960083 RepID=A0A8H9H7U9_9ACTO|nr:hypothetical protein [Actinomyces gaoshouyii]GGO95978.1 lipoprotein [Actinomyces gaoshouyii]
MRLPQRIRASRTCRPDRAKRTGRTGTAVVGASLAAAAVLGACSGGSPSDATASATASAASTGAGAAARESGQGDGHGHVDGATELSEAPLSLVTASSDGRVSLLDLTADGAPAPITSLPGLTATASDSRFVALTGPDGALSLVDSGVWTWDHGDHQHYYRAAARDLGALGMSGSASVASTNARTVIASGTTATVLDRQALGQGSQSPLTTASIDAGSFAAPLGERTVLVSGGQASIIDDSGQAIGQSASCPSASGGTLTRAGIVLGCRGGVVVAPEPSSAATAEPPSPEWVPLPGEAAGARIVSLSNQARRSQVAALDDAGGAWLLSVRDRSWTRVSFGAPVVAVSAMDDTRKRVVGVDAEGRVRVWADGAEATVTEPIADPALAASAGVRTTPKRAYVPGADGASVLEIDAADSARLARTLPAVGMVSFEVVGA